MIDTLYDQEEEEDIVVAGLYCDYSSQQEHTVTNMMGAILKQLVSRREMPKYLREAFQEAKKETGGGGLRPADLMGILRVAIASLPQAFICVDALDECLPKHLPELLESLRDIVQECPRARIFLTGRPHVQEAVCKYFAQVVVIPISPNPNDIKNYLEMRLDMDDEPEAMSDGLRADIMRVILEKIPDMCVGPVSVSTLSMMCTYEWLCADSSLFRSTWTLF